MTETQQLPTPGTVDYRAVQVETFMRTYVVALRDAVREFPEDYPKRLSTETLEDIVQRIAAAMRRAFVNGSYNKDGRAIKATCKALGIKWRYSAMEQFFTGELDDGE